MFIGKAIAIFWLGRELQGFTAIFRLISISLAG
jgi:hypothetical protein